MWAESELGRGSTFHFETRFEKSRDSVAKLVSAPADLNGVSVLIVDDNATNRRVLSETVRRWGAAPICVESGSQALAELLRTSASGKSYQLILLDAMMPDMDGFEVAARIARDPNLNRGAILMLTSADGQGDAPRCRELGIAAYLVKPVKPHDLNRAIATALQTAPIHLAAKVVEAVPAAERPLRILLAEDNAVNRLVIVKLLEKQGHTLTVAHHGGEAVNAMDTGAFDLVLMDVQMPEMDGFEATAVIRAKEAKSGTHRTPIVAMTAHAMKGDRERCLANGMDDYVSKPIQRAELNRVLRWAAERSTDAGCKKGDPELPICDRLEAVERLGGDSSLFAELVALFITDAPVQLASAATALRNGDAHGLKRVGHTLIGAAGYLGGTPVVTAARRLEEVGEAEDWNAAHGAYANLANEIHRLTAALASGSEESLSRISP